MIRKAIAIGAALAAALTVTVSAGAVPCCFTNGSFESNDLTGWTPSLDGGSAFTVAGGAPGGGSYHARVVAGDESAWQTLSQSASGPQGWIRGWVRFNDAEGFGSCFFNDQAEVYVEGTLVWSASSCATGSTGWVKVGGWVNAGSRDIRVRVRNTGDSTVDSSVDLDLVFRDVRFAPAP